MTDLAILVPSRGRPASVARLVEACEKTCRTSVVLHFGFDLDDETRPGVLTGSIPLRISEAERMGLAPWTNKLAADHMDAPYLASLGDDHVPETDGWDELLVTAIEHIGGGLAYPNDWRRIDIPEAIVIDTRIVAALGWMACPAMEHWCIDDVWADLGRGADCLVFCSDVSVRHLNPGVVSGVTIDRTYADAAQSWDRDCNAYKRWRLYDMHKDIAKVEACLNRPRSAR